MSGLERVGWLLVAAAVIGSAVIGLAATLELEPVQLFARIRMSWAALPLVTLVLAVCGVLALPVAPVILVAGSLWGWGSAPWVAVGMGAGATLGYAVGRFGAGAAHHDGGRRLQGLAVRYGALTALLSRWLPGVPFAVQNLSCGALRIAFPPYILGTAIGVGASATAFLFAGNMGQSLMLNAANLIRGAWFTQGLLMVVGGAMVWVARRRAAALSF